MPELPEVEVLVRHLAPRLARKRIESLRVFHPRLIRPHSASDWHQALAHRVFDSVSRRGKYLLFHLKPHLNEAPLFIGHLGMTGRIFLQPANDPLPRHAGVVFNLSNETVVFEDPRRFGHLHMDAACLARLGPEPWDPIFTPKWLEDRLLGSKQPIKIKLLDQTVVAGIGNIYASEILHRSGISPNHSSGKLNSFHCSQLHAAIQTVLSDAIQFGLQIPLDFAGGIKGIFYFGNDSKSEGNEEKFAVYARSGLPCRQCGTGIQKMVQAARSTFYCPTCQPV